MIGVSDAGRDRSCTPSWNSLPCFGGFLSNMMIILVNLG